jgi:hypothetical protein
MDKDTLARALDVCVQKMLVGDSLEGIVQLYPQLTKELTPPLEAVQAINVYRANIHVQPSLIAEKRANFLNQIEQDKKSALTQSHRYNSRVWLLVAALLLIFLAVIGGTLLASKQALPGESLYPIKEAIQQAQLSLIRQPQDRLDFELSVEDERITEIKALQAMERSQEVRFSGGLTQAENNQWQVGDLTVEVPDGAQLVGRLRPGIWVQVEGLLQSDGNIIAQNIKPREFIIKGLLEQPPFQQWAIAGVPILLNNETILQGNPSAGKNVEARVFLLTDGKLLARWIAFTPADIDNSAP